jgi:hypothetical protein
MVCPPVESTSTEALLDREDRDVRRLEASLRIRQTIIINNITN